MDNNQNKIDFSKIIKINKDDDKNLIGFSFKTADDVRSDMKKYYNSKKDLFKFIQDLIRTRSLLGFSSLKFSIDKNNPIINQTEIKTVLRYAGYNVIENEDKIIIGWSLLDLFMGEEHIRENDFITYTANDANKTERTAIEMFNSIFKELNLNASKGQNFVIVDLNVAPIIKENLLKTLRGHGYTINTNIDCIPDRVMISF